MSEKVLTPMKAIRAKCMECSNNQYYEITMCPMTDCPLYRFRSGHRPKRDANPINTTTERAEVKK